MKIKSVGCVALALFFITGCTVVSAGADMSAPSGDSLCEQSRGWGAQVRRKPYKSIPRSPKMIAGVLIALILAVEAG